MTKMQIINQNQGQIETIVIILRDDKIYLCQKTKLSYRLAAK